MRETTALIYSPKLMVGLRLSLIRNDLNCSGYHVTELLTTFSFKLDEINI